MEQHQRLLERAKRTLEAAAINYVLPELTGPLVEHEAQHGVLVGAGALLGARITVGIRDLVILYPGAELTRCQITFKGRGHVLAIGPNVKLKNVVFQSTGRDCTTIVGENTTWESGALLCGREQRSVIIGPDCMFSNSVSMRTSDAHPIFDLQTREQVNHAEDIVIHPHVWLGNGVRVGKGSIIGANSVVGQLSLTSKILDPNCVYAGVPARKLREGIIWSRSSRFDDIPPQYVADPR